jgi:putative ABC transport system permease protein
MWRLILERAAAQPALTLARCLGLTLLVVLITADVLYAGATGTAMLQASLRGDPSAGSLAVTSNPPPAQPMTLGAYQALDAYMRYRTASDLGLPVHGLRVHLETSTVPFYRWGQPVTAASTPLGSLALDYYQGLADQVRVVAGQLPGDEPDPVIARIAVAVSVARALHLHLGQRLALAPDGLHVVPRPLLVSALYSTRAPTSAFWTTNAGDTPDQFVVVGDPYTFIALTGGSLALSPSYFWLFDLDLRSLSLDQAPALLSHLQRFTTEVALQAPHTTLLTSLDTDVSGFLTTYQLVGLLLYVFALPIAVLLLYAMSVVGDLILGCRGDEVTLLRSRGVTRRQVALLALGEGLLLALPAAGLGLLLALALARLIGRASGFLAFGGGLEVPIHADGMAAAVAAGVALAGLIAGLPATWRASGEGTAAAQRHMGRPSRRPLWQRLYLDLVVLLLGLYGYVLLRRQGPVTVADGQAVLIQDPVLALAPAAFIVGCTLVLVRLVPLVSALVLAGWGPAAPVPLVLGARRLIRTPGRPTRLALLLALTLALGSFAAAVAATSSAAAQDTALYATGSTLRVVEYDPRLKRDHLMSLSWHRAIPGIAAMSPLLRFEPDETGDAGATVLGVDPASLGSVAWWRPDFAAQPLSSLLQRLHGPAALVSPNFLAQSGLRQGDHFSLSFPGGAPPMSAVVVGEVRYFPTLDPGVAPFILVNLDTLLRASRSPGPGELWIKTAAAPAVIGGIVARIRTAPRHVFDFTSLDQVSSSGDPLRAGLYGIVSLGFLGALALCILSLLVYAGLALIQRAAELAVVRTLGLSMPGAVGLLVGEQSVLIAWGAGAGVVSAALATLLFVPYLPLAQSVLPPFVAHVSPAALRDFAVLLLGIFTGVILVETWSLRRAGLARTLRLGQ